MAYPCLLSFSYINLFVPNARFFNQQKTLENRSVFWYFQGLEKGVHWEQRLKKGTV